MYESYKHIAVSRRGRILTVTLNRPEVRNATNPVLHDELSRIFWDVAKDPEADVIVLTGAGDAFSAGGDINSMVQKLDDHALWERTVDEARGIIYGLIELEKPLIARVNGHAVGLGATLALYSDIIIAAEHAKIGDPHVKVGLVAGDGGSLIWPLLIGYPRAKEYLLTGELLTAKEAAAIGLINRAVPGTELDTHVDGVAEKLAAGPTKAIRWTKKAINLGLKQLLHAQIETHFGLETMSHLTEDHREAVHAFRDKRTPRFSGR